MTERFGDLSAYTTDELVSLGAHSMVAAIRSKGDMFESTPGRLATELARECVRRGAIRNAWLDHCNEVAGEVIA